MQWEAKLVEPNYLFVIINTANSTKGKTVLPDKHHGGTKNKTIVSEWALNLP